MSLSDEVRQHVHDEHIQPARDRGETQFSVTVGKIQSEMGWSNRLPLIAGAIGADLFEHNYRVKRLSREGPQNGSTLTFTFEILP